MPFHLRYSLFQALLLYVIVPLAAALGLAGYLSLATIEDRVEEKMQDEVQLVARSLQLPLSHALERGRAMSIVRALESAFQINRVYAVSVYGRNGNLIASVGASVWDHNDQKNHERIAAMAEEGDKQEEYGQVGGQKAYSYFVPLTDSGGRINGLLQLSRKKEDFREHIAELRLQIGYILLGGTGVMILLVVFGHRNALGCHLERLGRSMRQVEQGDRLHRISLHGPKEITALATTFNTMLDSMDQAQKALEEHRQEQARLEAELRKAEKMAAVGRLAAGVAHELGTPLSIVAGQAQRAGRSADLPAKVDRALEHIRDQVQRMESIVRQLLDFSRNSSSCRREVDPAHVVHKTLQSLVPLAEEHNIQLEEAQPQSMEDCLVTADPLRLEQMLTNLVHNAIQAAPPGQGRVILTWECTAENCVFSVQDNGPGIPPDLISKVCDPFFTTKAVGEGTGLGLAVVHGIVEEHHGSLHIETSPLGGAQVRVVLPRTPADQKA
ncbi:MAG: sensor histidine kinase [Desulfovermiculus sp.]|nr:sensor histidine kinase [Desulfovermiculus sp.]